MESSRRDRRPLKSPHRPRSCGTCRKSCRGEVLWVIRSRQSPRVSAYERRGQCRQRAGSSFPDGRRGYGTVVRLFNWQTIILYRRARIGHGSDNYSDWTGSLAVRAKFVAFKLRPPYEMKRKKCIETSNEIIRLSNLTSCRIGIERRLSDDHWAGGSPTGPGSRAYER